MTRAEEIALNLAVYRELMARMMSGYTNILACEGTAALAVREAAVLAAPGNLHGAALQSALSKAAKGLQVTPPPRDEPLPDVLACDVRPAVESVTHYTPEPVPAPKLTIHDAPAAGCRQYGHRWHASHRETDRSVWRRCGNCGFEEQVSA